MPGQARQCQRVKSASVFTSALNRTLSPSRWMSSNSGCARASESARNPRLTQSVSLADPMTTRCCTTGMCCLAVSRPGLLIGAYRPVAVIDEGQLYGRLTGQPSGA